MENLQKFILRRQPHIICINGYDLTALRLREDIMRMLQKMHDANDIQFEIPVEITDDSVAKVYMNSQMAAVFIYLLTILIFLNNFSKNMLIILHF